MKSESLTGWGKMKSNNRVLKVRTELLSPRSLALISEFALILYRHTGIILEVGSSNAVSKVFTYSAHLNEPRLQEICNALRADLISKFSPQSVVNHFGQSENRERVDRPH